MSWIINDEESYINILENDRSVATLPKEETVLRIVLAGEPGNQTTVDQLHIIHSGLYSTEVPWNDVLVGEEAPSNVEDFRTKLLAFLNDLPDAGGPPAESDSQLVITVTETPSTDIAITATLKNTTGATFSLQYLEDSSFNIIADGDIFEDPRNYILDFFPNNFMLDGAGTVFIPFVTYVNATRIKVDVLKSTDGSLGAPVLSNVPHLALRLTIY